MDPYLESPELWLSFHHLLANEIMAHLNAKLSEKYYADVEVKTMLEEVGISTTHLVYPDAAVLDIEPQSPGSHGSTPTLVAPIHRVAIPAEQAKLRTVLVYLADNKALVTAIEILSPINKRGQGLQRYRQKRERLLHTTVHLVEIDLLRAGQRPGWEVDDRPLDTDYICLVNRANYGEARISEIWPVALNEALPTIPIPLLADDPDVLLELPEVMAGIYTRAAYARRIDYNQPVPTAQSAFSHPRLAHRRQTWFDTALTLFEVW